MAQKVKSLPQGSLRRSFGFLVKYRNIAVGVYVLALIINGLTIIIPQAIRWIIDVGVIGQNLDVLVIAVIGLLVLTVVKGVY